MDAHHQMGKRHPHGVVKQIQATILVTTFKDERVFRALESLRNQGAKEILVADGGSSAEYLDRIRAMKIRGLRIVVAPGSVAETRSIAIHEVKTPIVAFFDADEVAPENWLAQICGPIIAGRADVVGAPTKPFQPPVSKTEAKLNAADDEFYHVRVAHDQAALPMGNSAWRTATILEAGGFDSRLTMGGEDFDLNLRTQRLGARYEYAPSAWVYHDQSHLNRFGKVWRRAIRYSHGATIAYLKNDVLGERAKKSIRTRDLISPTQSALIVAKGIGYLKGRKSWKKWGQF